MREYESLKKLILKYKKYISYDMSNIAKKILKELIANDLLEIIDSKSIKDTDEFWSELYESRRFSSDILEIYNSFI